MTRNQNIKTGSARFLAAVLVVLAFAAAASAATLDDYRQRLRAASVQISELGGIQFGENDELVDTKIKAVLETLPASEKVEWNGGSLATDNGWLTTRLSEFRAATDISERNRILAAANERIASIAAGLEDLEKHTAAGTKDADKQKLGQILERPEYQKLPPPQKNKLAQWLEEFLNWLARMMPRSNVTPSAPGELASLTMVLQIVLYAIAFGLVGFLIYKFAPVIFPKLRRKSGGKKKDRVILGEKIKDRKSVV